MRTVWSIILCVLASFNVAFGQDIQFSQFYMADIFLNPALTGRAHNPRLMAHERIQWPKLDGKYITTMVGFDTYSEKYNSGAGLFVIHDVQGKSYINTTELNFLYSYNLHVTNDFYVRFGLDYILTNRHIDYTRLIYPDQLSDDGVTEMPSENYDNKRIWYNNFSSGLLAYSSKFWFGYTIRNMNRPNQSFFESNEARLPVKHEFIGGYKIDLAKTSFADFTGYEKPFYIFPMIHYKFQGKSDQVDIGLQGLDDQLMFGIWYRGIPFKKYKDNHNNESMILMAGWRFLHFTVSYSYDFVFSRLQPSRTGGAHEINLTYTFFSDNKSKVMKTLPCPYFQGSRKNK